MSCSLNQSSSPYILKDPCALESWSDFSLHSYHHLFLFQLCKKHSAGHFIQCLIKIVKQLPAAHTKLWSRPLSHTKSSPDSSLSTMAHSSSVAPPPSKPRHGHCKTLLPNTYAAINQLADVASLRHLMKTGTWKPPKGRVDLSQDETKRSQQQLLPACIPPILFKIL